MATPQNKNLITENNFQWSLHLESNQARIAYETITIIGCCSDTWVEVRESNPPIMRSQRTVLIDSPTTTYLVGALGIEPSQPTGNGFTDRPPSLEEYAPNFGTQDRTCTCTLSPIILSHSCLLISSLGRIWCPRPESNRYAFRRGILSAWCLPFHHLGIIKI